MYNNLILKLTPAELNIQYLLLVYILMHCILFKGLAIKTQANCHMTTTQGNIAKHRWESQEQTNSLMAIAEQSGIL
jgi:hypothetical protein